MCLCVAIFSLALFCCLEWVRWDPQCWSLLTDTAHFIHNLKISAVPVQVQLRSFHYVSTRYVNHGLYSQATAAQCNECVSGENRCVKTYWQSILFLSKETVLANDAVAINCVVLSCQDAKKHETIIMHVCRFADVEDSSLVDTPNYSG